MERPDAGARQLERRVADVVQHPPHDPVAALVDHDAQQRAALLGAHRAHLIGDDPLALDGHAQPQALQHLRRRIAVEQGLVLFLEFVARVSHAEGEVAVVGQQEQARGGAVEPADRYDPLGDVDEIHHGPAPALVAHGRDVAGGLVEHDVAATLGPQPLTVDADVLPIRIDHGAELTHHLTVDGDAPFENELLGLAPRGHAARGQDSLQTFQNHS